MALFGDGKKLSREELIFKVGQLEATIAAQDKEIIRLSSSLTHANNRIDVLQDAVIAVQSPDAYETMTRDRSMREWSDETSDKRQAVLEEMRVGRDLVRAQEQDLSFEELELVAQRMQSDPPEAKSTHGNKES